MAKKQIIFLKGVKTPYGDVLKGEILTGNEFNKITPANAPNMKAVSTPGFIFNFYEKKDPVKFNDKTVEETFFIPRTSFGTNGIIREVVSSDLKPKPSLGKSEEKPVEIITNSNQNNNDKSNKMISFAIGTLAGLVVSYFVFKKLGK